MTTTALHTILTDLLKDHSLEAIQAALSALGTEETLEAPSPVEAPVQSVEPAPIVQNKPESTPEVTTAIPEVNDPEPVKSEPEIPVVEEEPAAAEVHDPENKRRLALNQMRHFAMWNNAAGNKKWQQEYRIFIKNGGKDNQAQKTKQHAQEILGLLKPIQRDIFDNPGKYTKRDLPEAGRRLMKKFGPYSYDIKKSLHWAIRRSVEGETLAREEDKLTKNIPKTKNTPIQDLPHKANWDLLIDESGREFSADGKRSQAYFVGVLAPSDDTVPPLEIHGMDESIEPKLKVLKDLMERPDWSMFGLPLSTIAKVRGEQWIDGVTEIIAWVIRLMPADEPTTLTVYVEQREPHAAGSEQDRLQRVLLQSLAQVNEARANNITLDVRFVYKYHPEREAEVRSEDEDYPTHRWLAYADIVAHLWHSKEKVYKTWIKETGLGDTFLHKDLTPKHMRILDAALETKSSGLTGESWSDLIGDTRSKRSAIIEYISNCWKTNTTKDTAQWNRCIEELQRHLYSKRINMVLLTKQSAWLQDIHANQNTLKLSQRDQLVFRMSQLASKNHAGHVVTEQEIIDLQHAQSVLLDEDIRLICFLDLHVAVQFTHTYTFDRAIQLMEHWANTPTRTIGLNYKGRVLSTLGQLYTFKHEYAKGIEYLDKALDTFGQLSTESEKLEEQRQTRSYKVIAMMDSDTYSNTDIEAELIKLHPTCHTMSQLCGYLQRRSDDADKYTHHIFIRYLYCKKPTELTQQYLSGWKKWQSGVRHPWSWINAYRAMLVTEAKQKGAHKWFEEAVKQCSFYGIEEGIGLILLEFARRNKTKVDDKYISRKRIDHHVRNVASKLPTATPFHNNIERALTDKQWSHREWLKLVLPFNFH